MPSNVVFYVYVYRDPRPGKNLEPIYIGKGRGYRYRQHWNRTEDHRNPLLCRVLNKIRAVSLKPKIKIVRRFVLEADAFAYEIKLIAKYGRRDLGLGPLCNLTDGGDGLLEVWPSSLECACSTLIQILPRLVISAGDSIF